MSLISLFLVPVNYLSYFSRRINKKHFFKHMNLCDAQTNDGDFRRKSSSQGLGGGQKGRDEKNEEYVKAVLFAASAK